MKKKYNMNRFTIDPSVNILITSETESGKTWNINFVEPSGLVELSEVDESREVFEPFEGEIVMTIEALKQAELLGKMLLRSKGEDLELTYSSRESSITFQVSPSGHHGNKQVTLKTPSGTIELTLGRDNNILLESLSEIPEISPIPDLTSVIKLLAEVAQPLNEFLEETPPSVVFAGKKTEKECKEDYANALTKIGGGAIVGASAAAGAASTGLGAFVGLGILLGTYFIVKSEEKDARKKLDKCIKDAGSPT